MEKGKENTSSTIASLFTIGMAIIAYLIGAGYSSGQEILQFFVSFGKLWWVPVFTAFFVIFWACMSFAKAGIGQNFKKNEDLYYYYGGKYIGKFFDYSSNIVVFCMTFYMLSAAGSTLGESFGTPLIVGTIIVGLAIILTLFTGFSGLSKVLAISGTINILLIIVISIYTLVTNFQYIPDGIALVESGNSGLLSAGNGPISAGLAYHGISTLYIGVFIVQTSRVNHKNATTRGCFWGSVGFTLLTIMSVFTMFSVLPDVAEVDVPNLALAYRITPAAGSIFTFIIMLEVYNSVSALVWTVANRFEPDEKSSRFKIITVVLVAVAIVITTLLPYKVLVGKIMTYGGYIGGIFFASVIIKDIRIWINNHQSKVKNA